MQPDVLLAMPVQSDDEDVIWQDSDSKLSLEIDKDDDDEEVNFAAPSKASSYQSFTDNTKTANNPYQTSNDRNPFRDSSSDEGF